jgi:hypothetical protein
MFGCILIAGCSTAAIAIKEQFGYAKREQLVSAVTDARDSQEAAKKQFASALDEFISVTGVKGGELEAKYRSLNAAYEKSKSRADDVRSQIKSVDNVAQALFKEWKGELSQYQNASLRGASEKQLNDTQALYDRLLSSMKQAEGKMDPVLSAFHDQVLFLKHNLNAQAIAGLQGNVAQIQSDVTTLVHEMEASIAESNRFIEQMQDKAAG